MALTFGMPVEGCEYEEVVVVWLLTWRSVKVTVVVTDCEADCEADQVDQVLDWASTPVEAAAKVAKVSKRIL